MEPVGSGASRHWTSQGSKGPTSLRYRPEDPEVARVPNDLGQNSLIGGENMSPRSKVLFGLLGVFAVLPLSMPGASGEWWHSTGGVSIKGDQNECLRRARLSLQHELKGVGQITQAQGAVVQLEGQNTSIIITCYSCGHGNSVAFISVTADPRRAKRFRDVLYDSIKRGGPYE